MKPTEQSLTTRGSRWGQGLRRLAAITAGSEAPWGLDLRQWFALSIVGYMGFLLVQFGMGMGINLFITIPQNHPGADATNFVAGFFESVVWGIVHGPLLVTFHVVFGLVLLVHPVFLALRLPPLVRASMWPTAAVSGAAYLTYHQDLYSLLMALGFGGAMLCYAITLYLVIRPTGTTAAPTPRTPAPQV
jgi:hypothetical protein